MGLLDAAGQTLSDFAAPLRGIFGDAPELLPPDFDSFDIQELLEDGTEEGVLLQLVGEWRPHQPFSWGGKQRLIKEYYPGNDEPTVQVLGSQENNVKLTGRFKVKKLNGDPETFRAIPAVLCDAIDDIRRRGSLVKLSLGEWVRYGFIEDTSWKMKTLADIEYEIDFFIIGDSLPSQCKLNDEGSDVPDAENLQLIKAAVSLEQIGALPFTGMDLNLFQQLNALIGTVATAVSLVTKFVDGVVSAAENVEGLANRAIGLIKYTQATISTFKRRVGALNAYPGVSAVGAAWDEARRSATAKYMMQVQMATTKPIQPSAAQVAATAKTAKASTYTPTVSRAQQADASAAASQSVDALLQAMLAKFQKIAEKLPMARYLVRQGDTLQQISTKFYKTPDNWKRIYDHNQLSTPVLVAGTVLEIPKL